MRSVALLAAAFGGTLAVLLLGFFALRAVTGGSLDPTAAPSADLLATPTEFATERPTARPTRTPRPAPSASGGSTSPGPSGTPGPTAGPTGTPRPTLPPGTVITITVKGRDYVSAEIPPNGTVKKQGDSAILHTDRSMSLFLGVTWDIPPGSIPFGAKIARIDSRVCGSGSGDFWETYGPDGSEPFEYAVEEPSPDGCWYFTNAPGPDTAILSQTRTEATLRIDKIVYTITLR
ncbi:MAG: hypothetical protein V4515_04380 [Chloroflexota bacterium]